MKKILLLLFLILGVGVMLNGESAGLRRTAAMYFSPQGEVDPAGLEALLSVDQWGEYEGEKVYVPSIDVAQLKQDKSKSVVLGNGSDDKRIEVDLTNQRLYAYEGDRMVYNFLVSTGKWGRTPTGDFRIWIKLRATKMSGGNRSLRTYYYLPNVPYVMYFYNASVPQYRGYGIHGTYWHSNFGHPMSHGCINMKTEEAALLYEWANPVAKGGTTYASAEDPGTLIRIYGQAPLN